MRVGGVCATYFPACYGFLLSSPAAMSKRERDGGAGGGLEKRARGEVRSGRCRAHVLACAGSVFLPRGSP